jgi:hypothetical protein
MLTVKQDTNPNTSPKSDQKSASDNSISHPLQQKMSQGFSTSSISPQSKISIPSSMTPQSSPPLEACQTIHDVLQTSTSQIDAQINQILNGESKTAEVKNMEPEIETRGNSLSLETSPRQMDLPFRLKSDTPPEPLRRSRRRLGGQSGTPPSPFLALELLVPTVVLTLFHEQAEPPERPETPIFDRPSPSQRSFVENLGHREKKILNDASADGEFVFGTRGMKLVVEEKVAVRDFTYEALARKKEAEGKDKLEESTTCTESPPQQTPSRNLEVGESSPDGGRKLTSREQSFKNIYGAFNFKAKLQGKDEEKEENSSSDDEKSGLFFGRKRK